MSELENIPEIIPENPTKHTNPYTYYADQILLQSVCSLIPQQVEAGSFIKSNRKVFFTMA